MDDDRGKRDEGFMREALKEADLARESGEVPVGCVAVRGERIIARAHNQREMLQDPTAHAEMIALTQASAEMGSWRLEGVCVFVTLEPCAMCAGAMVLARIERLVYGATDPKAGAVESVFRIPDEKRLNHRIRVTSGVLAGPCGAVLSDFFRQRRRAGAAGAAMDAEGL